MRFTGYRGPYKDGFPSIRVADDGSMWREATPKELAEAPDDLLVYFGRTDSQPFPKSLYADTVLPGGTPYLVGIAVLLPVYIQCSEEEREASTS